MNGRVPLEVAIETLVLHGLDLGRADAERVREALAAELSARLTRDGAEGLLARASGAVPTIRLSAGDSPEAMASGIADGMMGRRAREGGAR